LISRTAVFKETESLGASTLDLAANRPRLMSLLVLSAWCGLVAGLLEVGAVVIRKQVFDPDHLYKMSRHFVWLIPLSNFCVFVTLGLLGCVVILVWPRRGRCLLARAFCALALLPTMLVAVPQIHGLAWLLVALGVAVRLVPILERNRRVLWRFVLFGFPVAIAIVTILGASLWVEDRIRQARETARPAPPPGSPNVLLIVMDTVAASHLSLHGYHRATGTTLIELAERGICFDSARAASSWTLPSHATMFTGRWLHELSVDWVTPLDRKHPTLAEFLGQRGYSTAGFVANMSYCATDSGLARGFTHYRDFIFPEFTALKTAVLVKRLLSGFQTLVYFTEDWLSSIGLLPHVQRIWQSLDTDRKGAAVVNREFLHWLSKRSGPERPFFAFLNYFDAHHPYQLTTGRLHRFGVEPADNYHRILIRHWWELDKMTLPAETLAFATDAYDDCIADLDEQLGKLVDELDRRGVLNHTWLFITSDHGESFGEHAGIFCHGQSLYETELHVPLLVIPPGGSAKKQAVSEPVSLRDVAATIVDVAGLGQGAPFPGRSLARLWKQPTPGATVQPPSTSPALAEVVPIDQGHHDSWGVFQQLPPLRAVKGKDWSYIRREGDVRDELFHLRDDPKEEHNLAGEPATQSTLEQMRRTLDGLTGGPLLSRRFGHR
jgi:arylsulfatase A-like enzyme